MRLAGRLAEQTPTWSLDNLRGQCNFLLVGYNLPFRSLAVHVQHSSCALAASTLCISAVGTLVPVFSTVALWDSDSVSLVDVDFTADLPLRLAPASSVIHCFNWRLWRLRSMGTSFCAGARAAKSAFSLPTSAYRDETCASCAATATRYPATTCPIPVGSLALNNIFSEACTTTTGPQCSSATQAGAICHDLLPRRALRRLPRSYRPSAVLRLVH